MANFSALKTAIQNAIRTNGNNEITGQLLQDILLSMVVVLGDEAITNVADDLSTETSQRQNADGTLQGNINAEATARATADAALQNAINTINSNISNGYVYAGIATPSATPVTGKVFYIATTAGTYTNFGGLTVTKGINILKYNGSTWSQEQIIRIDDYPTAGSSGLALSGGVDAEIKSLVGYYTCGTAAATAAKTITASAYILLQGGSIKVKFTYKNTAADATLKIGSADAKPLFYGGRRAGSSNSWEAGEVVEIFYDGTNYMANNVMGGGAGDGAFDISVYNAVDGTPTPYTDLAAALGTNGANIPDTLRKGGMSVKFIQGTVQSSDNKYVQARCMAQNFTTDVTQWQGVDNVPTAGSDNLVESGGVEERCQVIELNSGTVELTDKYWGFYCSNVNTGLISQANSTYNGFLVKVTASEKYKIVGTFAYDMACYSGFPSTETFTERKPVSDYVTMPVNCQYIVLTVELASASSFYRVSRINNLEPIKLARQKSFFECSTVSTTATKVVNVGNSVDNITNLIVRFNYGNSKNNVSLIVQADGKDSITKPLFYNGKAVSDINHWESGDTLVIIYNETDDRFESHLLNSSDLRYYKGNSFSVEGVTDSPDINMIVRGLHLLESDKANLDINNLYLTQVIINNSGSHRIAVSDGTTTITIINNLGTFSKGSLVRLSDNEGRYAILCAPSDTTYNKSFGNGIVNINSIVFSDYFVGMLSQIPARLMPTIPTGKIADNAITYPKLETDAVKQSIENSFGVKPAIYGLAGADASKVIFANSLIKSVEIVDAPEDYVKGCVRLRQIYCMSASSASVRIRFMFQMIIGGEVKYGTEAQNIYGYPNSEGTAILQFNEYYKVTVDLKAIYNCGLSTGDQPIFDNTVNNKYAVYPTNDFSFIGGTKLAPLSVDDTKLTPETLEKVNTNLGFLYGKKLVTLCDSMGNGSQWQSLLASLTGAVYNKQLNDGHYSVGGTKTFNVNSNGNDGQSRANMLVNEALIIPDVIIYENVNDTEGLTTGSSDDEPFFRTKQEELNITSQESQQAAKDYWDNNFATIVGGKIPQIGTILGVPFTSNNGVKVTIGNTPSASGNITFSISGAGTKSISVEAGESIASIIAKIIEYDWNLYIDEVDPQDANSVIFTKTDGTTPSSFVIDAGSTGVSITKTENVSGTLYVWKIFRGHDISKWTNSDYWVESITRWAMWKGVIEYLQTNFPQALIYWLLPSTWDFNTSTLPTDAFYPDGSLNVKYILANKQTYHFESEIAFCELYQIPIIDLRNEAGINPINASTYCNAGNVHPKQLAYNRWAEVIAQQIN